MQCILFLYRIKKMHFHTRWQCYHFIDNECINLAKIIFRIRKYVTVRAEPKTERIFLGSVQTENRSSKSRFGAVLFFCMSFIRISDDNRIIWS